MSSRDKSNSSRDKSITITLRIKKFWLDEIASGRKKIEYRIASKHNCAMIEGKSARVRWMRLHYQRSRRLLCRVSRIERKENMFLIHISRARIYYVTR